MSNIQIKCFKNIPIDSNCFVIIDYVSNESVIIDPGSENSISIIDFLDSNNIRLEYIILTHEHFDHIWGVNELKVKYNCKVICSNECADKVVDKRKNLSLFYNQIGFEILRPDIVFSTDSFLLRWNDINFDLFKTKGHSDACICIYINNFLFTGDTLIKDEKTVLKLPNSCKDSLLESLLIIELKCNSQTHIYPGHGDSFLFEKKYLNNCI